MFAEKNIPHKKSDEKILIYLHPHWIHLLNSGATFIAMVALPVVIYFTAQESLAPLLENPSGFVLLVMLAGIYYLSAILITFNSFLDRILDVWVVTNYRIIAIEQRGLFNRAFTEHLIERIQDVSSTKKGLLQTFLNYGTVEIQTAGEQEQFKFADVKDPEKIVQTINELLSQKIQNKPVAEKPNIGA